MKHRLLHVITGLGGGGAEFMLERLILRLPAQRYTCQVLSLTAGGVVAERLRGHGVAVSELGLARGPACALGLAALVRGMRAAAPDLVQTWLCHADLLGGVVGRYLLRKPVVWGVHQAAGGNVPWPTRAVLRACARLSGRLPARIIACSEAGVHAAVAAGYAAGRFTVIHNGVDLGEFRPDPTARARLRAELGIGEDTLLIGLPARWHADKDHANFFAAARRVLARRPEVRFVLCGEGIEAGNPALVAALAAAGVAGVCHLLGFRRDVAGVLAALDVGVLASTTEAMPNVIVETMACAVPFIATDVGDVAGIIGDTGMVVPARDAAALAAAMLECAMQTPAMRQARGDAARARVAARFSIERAVSAYAEVYDAVLHPAAAPACATP